MNASWADLDGKAVSLFTKPEGSIYREHGDVTFLVRYEFHGEYDDAWIIELHAGKETARHNVKHVESIIWKERP